MHLHLLIATFTFFTELVMTAPLLTDPSEVVITLSDNGLIQADSDVHTPERRAVAWHEDERLAELQMWYSHHHSTAADALALQAVELAILLQEWISEYQAKKLHATKQAAHREQTIYARLADELSIAYTSSISKLVHAYHEGQRGVKMPLIELLQRFFVLYDHGIITYDEPTVDEYQDLLNELL